MLILADGLDPASLLPALSTVSSIGFALWYSYYNVTSVIPKMLADHRAERTEMQERFDQALHALVDELKDTRRQHRKPPAPTDDSNG